MWADKCLRQQCSVFLQDRDSGQSPVELRLRIDKPFSLHLQIFDIDRSNGRYAGPRSQPGEADEAIEYMASKIRLWHRLLR